MLTDSHAGPKIVDNNFADELTFTISELNDALQAANCNKQPGPDGVIIELLKWLDAPNRDILLQIINSWWSTKTAPEELWLARVAPISKTGDTDVASNYRPISFFKEHLQGVYDDDQFQNAEFGRAPFNKDAVRFPSEQMHFTCHLPYETFAGLCRVESC